MLKILNYIKAMKKFITLSLLLLVGSLVFSGCVREPIPPGKRTRKIEGDIIEHKLSGKKCLIKEIGRDHPNWGNANIDYGQAECRFEDDSIEWIDLDEYKVVHNLVLAKSIEIRI